MDDTGSMEARFDSYLRKLCDAVEHGARAEPLRNYVKGLALPAETKSMEPIAARMDPLHVSAQHQSLAHFLGNATWSDREVMAVAREHALKALRRTGPVERLVVDDTGFPKKGKHSVGVANQYCGVLGKNANSQCTVAVTAVAEHGSVPVACQLYLPEIWSSDPARCKKAKVPEEMVFAKKWEIALDLIEDLLMDDESSLEPRTVSADAGYGDVVAFREGLTDAGLTYTVGISETTAVWAEGTGPLPPREWSGRGRIPTRNRRDAEHRPVKVKALAQALSSDVWTTVEWREGTHGLMRSRFARSRVRPAAGDTRLDAPRPEEWLLIEWPEGEAEPTRYWLSTENLDLNGLVVAAKLRWRVERDFQEMKSEYGLDKYEGRGWIGFHHHWSLCIAIYAFCMAEQARLFPPGDSHLRSLTQPPLPEGFRPRGAPQPR